MSLIITQLPALAKSALLLRSSAAPPLQHGDVLNVALLVWMPDAPYGLCDGDVTGKPGTAIAGSYGTTMVQPHLLGQTFTAHMDSRRAD